MFFTSKEKLRELIVLKLADSPYSSSREILQSLYQEGREDTEQALYKELRILIRDDVVIKTNSKYSLTLDWCIKLAELVESIHTKLNSSEHALSELLSAKKQRTWHFTKLKSMKRFWSQIILNIVSRNSDSTLYSWNPYPWFYLTDPEHQAAVMTLFKKNNIKMYKILGTKTYSKLISNQFWNQKNVVYSSNDSNFNGDMQSYLTILNEYSIEVWIDKKTTNKLESIFGSNKKHTRELYYDLYQLAKMNTKSSLTLSTQKTKILKQKKYFENYFP